MITEPKLLCLFSAPLVAPDGEPLGLLDIASERQVIVTELTGSGREIEVLFAPATTDRLSDSLRDGYNILHYSGHGHPEFLAFEDGTGGAQLVRGDWVKKVFSLVGNFQLGFVSACHSEQIGRSLVEAGIPHVVAVKLDTPVLDKAAIVFAREFYRHLFSGAPIQYAFDMAKLMVEGDPALQEAQPYLQAQAAAAGEEFTPESEKFLLLPDGEAFSRHQQAVCQNVPEGAVVDRTRPPSPGTEKLPARRSTFRGRTRQMYELIQETITSRLVTLQGAPGVGKTSLAIEALRWFGERRRFPDGVFNIDAREATGATDLLPQFGVLFGRDLPRLDELTEALAEKSALVLLDNLEDLLFAAETETRDLCDLLLRQCPNLKLMVTSQRAIGSVLHEPEKTIHLGVLEPPDDAALFVAMARRRVSLEEMESEEFGDLLASLGGHPLSIVLMAKQLTEAKSIADLNAQLSQGRAKAVEAPGGAGARGRHESLTAALAAAHASLSEEARVLFATMGLLPGGVQKAHISLILPGDSDACVDELLEVSLMEYSPGHDRYSMLPTIRMFAEDSIEEGEQEALCDRVFQFVLPLCSNIRRQCVTEKGGNYRLGASLEEPNFRAAFDRILQKQHSPSPDSLYQFCLLLSNLQELRCQFQTMAFFAEKGAELLAKADFKKEEAHLICSHATAKHHQGKLSEAELAYDQAIEVLRSVPAEERASEKCKLILFNVLNDRAELRVRCGRLGPALEDIAEAEMACEALDRPRLLAMLHRLRGEVLFRRGDYSEAVESGVQDLTLLNETPGENLLDRMNALWGHGGNLLAAERLAEAETCLSQALGLAKKMSHDRGSWQVFEYQGHLRLRQGHFEEVADYAEQGAVFYKGINDELGQVEMMMLWALAKAYSANLAEARELAERAFQHYERLPDWHYCVQWLLWHARHAASLPDPSIRQFFLTLAEECAARTTDDDLKAAVAQAQAEAAS